MLKNTLAFAFQNDTLFLLPPLLVPPPPSFFYRGSAMTTAKDIEYIFFRGYIRPKSPFLNERVDLDEPQRAQYKAKVDWLQHRIDLYEQKMRRANGKDAEHFNDFEDNMAVAGGVLGGLFGMGLSMALVAFLAAGIGMTGLGAFAIGIFAFGFYGSIFGGIGMMLGAGASWLTYGLIFRRKGQAAKFQTHKQELKQQLEALHQAERQRLEKEIRPHLDDYQKWEEKYDKMLADARQMVKRPPNKNDTVKSNTASSPNNSGPDTSGPDTSGPDTSGPNNSGSGATPAATPAIRVGIKTAPSAGAMQTKPRSRPIILPPPP